MVRLDLDHRDERFPTPMAVNQDQPSVLERLQPPVRGMAADAQQ